MERLTFIFIEKQLKSKLALALIYLVLCASIVLKIKVDRWHYLSPDSQLYLVFAENFLKGKGFVAPPYESYFSGEQASEKYYATWPMGYPLLIAGLSKLTGLSLLWASKMANFIFLGFIFLLLYQWLGKRAWFVSLYFFSYNMLEVFSYSWSEGPFLFFLLYLCYILQQSLKSISSTLFFELFLCLSLLFFFRYVGIIFFFYCFGLSLYAWFLKKYDLFLHLFIGIFLASIIVTLYLQFNYEQTGFFVGAKQFNPDGFNFINYIKSLLLGLLNSFAIARNYFGGQGLDLIFWLFLALQLALIFYLYSKRALFGHSSIPKEESSVKVLLSVSGFYLISIVTLKGFMFFDNFDYRILSPFHLPVFIALFYIISQEKGSFFQTTYKVLVAFLLLSLLINLPGAYLLNNKI